MTVDIRLHRPLSIYEKLYSSSKFIDRTEMLAHLNTMIGTTNKYVCITTPDTIGKTAMAFMVATYYSNNLDTKRLYDRLLIKNIDGYIRNLNKYNVIYLNMSMLHKPSSIEKYICSIEEKIIKTLYRRFYNVKISINSSLWQNFNKLYVRTNEKFIFVIDEWDYIFSIDEFTEQDRQEYLKFFAEFLLEADYVELAYVTGKYPLSTYSKAKCFNIFEEYLFV